MEINQREIWFVKFPLEEDSSKILQRPVVVISVSDDKMKILSVKVTKHEARDWDDYWYIISTKGFPDVPQDTSADTKGFINVLQHTLTDVYRFKWVSRCTPRHIGRLGVPSGAPILLRGELRMSIVTNGVYFLKRDLYDVIHSVGGVCADRKERPVIALVHSLDNDCCGKLKL